MVGIVLELKTKIWQHAIRLSSLSMEPLQSCVVVGVHGRSIAPYATMGPYILPSTLV